MVHYDSKYDLEHLNNCNKLVKLSKERVHPKLCTLHKKNITTTVQTVNAKFMFNTLQYLPACWQFKMKSGGFCLLPYIMKPTWQILHPFCPSAEHQYERDGPLELLWWVCVRECFSAWDRIAPIILCVSQCTVYVIILKDNGCYNIIKWTGCYSEFKVAKTADKHKYMQCLTTKRIIARDFLFCFLLKHKPVQLSIQMKKKNWAYKCNLKEKFHF